MTDENARLVQHLPLHAQTPRFTNPRADEDGYRRAFVPGVAGTSFGANQLVLPTGQGCPTHTFTGEVIIYMLAGSIRYVIADSAIDLAPGDYLFIPASTPYSYHNTSDGESRMLSIIGRVDDWPARSTFEGVQGELTIH